MKTFIYKVIPSSRTSCSKGYIMDCLVYRVIRNTPDFKAKVRWNSAGAKQGSQVIIPKLIEIGELKTSDVMDVDFRLIEV